MSVKKTVFTYCLYLFTLLELNGQTLIHLSTAKEPHTDLYKIYEYYYTELFRRMNMDFELSYIPLNRSEQQLKVQELDGEVARVYSYLKHRDDLIRLPQPIYSMTFSFYCRKNSEIEISHWSDLDNTDLRIDVRRGMAFIDEELKKYDIRGDLVKLNTTEQGLNRLKMDRSDVFIDNKISVEPYLLNDQYDFRHYLYESGIAETLDIHLYLHKRHEAIIPQINEVVIDLSSEQYFERCIWKVVGR